MGYLHKFIRVGFLGWLGFGSTTPTLGVQSPLAPTDQLATFAVDAWMRDIGKLVTTRETALSVPGLKRAHRLHCSLVAGLNFRQMIDAAVDADQPGWLTNSASGVSPYHRMFGVTSDLFFNGWACLGFTEQLDDAMHIPFGWWGADAMGTIVCTDPRIPDRYRARLVAIPMGYGENGILTDGMATIRAALRIEEVWMERIENPLPATNLHIDDPQFDGMSRREKRKIVDDWNENRKRAGGQTAVTQSFLKVESLGTVSADLFEKGRNAIRLDIANHAAVPASIIEGAKDGGGTDINYSNESAARNELYDFGTKAFVQAIEARLSLDDVCEPGKSIRADLSNLMAVTSPNTDPTSAD